MDVAELRRRAEAWMAGDPDASTVAELAVLLDRGAHAELGERFSGELEFGTAGLRGILGAGPNRMNRAVVRRTTAGLARYLKRVVPQVVERGVVVGRDGRRLSDELASDTAGVLAAEGIPAWVFEERVPTPLVAFATLHLGAAGAVMVTASHNPPEYNGYKVYWGNGAQIIPPHDKGIFDEIRRVESARQVPLSSPAEARSRGFWRDVPDSVGAAYLEAIGKLRLHRRAEGVRVAYTALHGVGGRWAERALTGAGFSVACVREQHEPDGDFPTVAFPNPEEPGAMDRVLALGEQTQADLVVANDPDADRLAAAVRDARGALVTLSGNELGVLLGHYLLAQRPASKPALVITTIVSSSQLSHIAQQLGARYEETLTGFKWIANRALDTEPQGFEFVFGYEEALGYTVGTVTRDKDGVGSALVLADLVAHCRAQGQTVPEYLQDIQRRHGLFVSAQRSFTFPGADGAQRMRQLMDAFRQNSPGQVGAWRVDEVRDYQAGFNGLPRANVLAFLLSQGARVTLRPSGTEPKLKYYFELREAVGEGEPLPQARARAEGRLAELERAVLALAHERGQP